MEDKYPKHVVNVFRGVCDSARKDGSVLQERAKTRKEASDEKRWIDGTREMVSCPVPMSMPIPMPMPMPNQYRIRRGLSP